MGAEDALLDKIMVERLLSRLTPEEQDIVRLRIYEGCTYAEISKYIGPKYRDGTVTGSAIRYIYETKILKKLASWIQ